MEKGWHEMKIIHRISALNKQGGPVPGAPQIKVLTHSYGHVLLEMQAPAGKAIVTQAGPHVYRVRIIP